MKSDAIQDFILKTEQNLRLASAVGDAWPKARGRLVSDFLDRLDSRLKKELRGWESEQQGKSFFIDAYAGYYIWKPRWEQLSVGLQCNYHGEQMVIGVARSTDNSRKQPRCPQLLDVAQKINPSATSTTWWEARIILQSPAVDWRKPEVLWQMHKDPQFLADVADQLLEIAEACSPIIDRWTRKKG